MQVGTVLEDVTYYKCVSENPTSLLTILEIQSLMLHRNVHRIIFKLLNCERVGRVSTFAVS